ncbi:MAG: hypothetical protein IJI25_11840 [Eubacterium sp.]|nr:hypothetical protein [Eubacterium sp.]
MNVLFLDIDGVLNSEEYYRSLTDKNLRDIPIDRTCLARVKHIVDETEAAIVLTSSWRDSWDKDPEMLRREGRTLNGLFKEYGLAIYDKTPVAHEGRRPVEIRQWLDNCNEKIGRFVILDDYDFNWKRHRMFRHWVRTDYEKGGLSDDQAEKAILLFRKSSFYFFMERFEK